MSELFQYFKVMFQENFGSVMFFLVAGIIALAFIGYLLIDYFKTLVMIFRIKRRHRLEAPHRHS